MNKHLQIRELPEETHRDLKERAASEGLSMSEFLKRLIERELSRPSWNEIEARMATMPPLDLKRSLADRVRDERDDR